MQRKNITLDVKLQVLKRVEAGELQVDVACALMFTLLFELAISVIPTLLCLLAHLPCSGQGLSVSPMLSRPTLGHGCGLGLDNGGDTERRCV